jgi:hypothetical protein
MRNPKKRGRRMAITVSSGSMAYPMGMESVDRWTIFLLISMPVIILKSFGS